MSATAALFHQSGSPHSFQSVELPTLDDGETLVEISVCSLCRSDIHTHQGLRIEPTPTILGHEIIGRVSESRAGWAVGTRVTWGITAFCGTCYFCQHGIPQKCQHLFKYGHMQVSPAEPLSGGLATHILLRKGTAIYEVPSALGDEIGALANCSTATASAVIRASGAGAGDIVVIFGAGILGVTTAAILHSRGCRVLVFDRVPAAIERALAFGAVAGATTDEDLRSMVENATDGRGADACLELSGQMDAVEQSIELARIGGRVVLAGTTTPVGDVGIAPEQVVRRLLTITGVHNYAPVDLETALEFLSQNHDRYPFGDLIGDSYSLADVDLAFTAAQRSAGKRIMVRPNG